MPEQPPPAAPASAGTCVIFQWPRAFQNEQLPETRWLRLAGSADRDRPLACCPACREVAFDGDVVESERKVQAHVVESGVVCGRKLLTPYDGLELGLHDGCVAGVLADDVGHIGRRQPVAIGLDHRAHGSCVVTDSAGGPARHPAFQVGALQIGADHAITSASTCWVVSSCPWELRACSRMAATSWPNWSSL